MRVEVESLHGFARACIDFADVAGKPRRGVLVLGDNGSGKSTLLRAVALGLAPLRDARALAGAWPGLAAGVARTQARRGRRAESRIRVELCDPGAPDQRFAITTRLRADVSGAVQVRRDTEPARGFPWQRVLVCGYGAQRGAAGRVAATSRRGGAARAPAARAAVASLFACDAPLMTPPRALQVLGWTRAGRRDDSALAAAVEGHLRALLGLGPRSGVALAGDRVDVRVSGGPGASVPWDALGHGARSTGAWLLDLLATSHRAGALSPGARPRGIALVDGIDAHLHPSRQREILGLVARRFPGLQLVATAQSPLLVADRAPGDVVLCRREGAGLAAHQDLPPAQGRDADAILRGPWFGLDATVDHETARLLAAYQDRARAGAGEDELAALREAVRARAGHLAASPLDELAVEVVAALRAELASEDSGHLSGDRRRALVAEAAARLRRRLEEHET